MVIRPETVTRMLTVTGSVEAVRSVRVSPRVIGRLTDIVHYEGEQVHAGETLARLEDVAATTLVREQQASLRSIEAELLQAQRDLARAEQLVRQGARAAAELEPARLAVARDREEVRRLSALLREGRSQLSLSAPFDGTIIRRAAELGQLVGPENDVFEIATVADARVSAEVDERYVRALRPGMQAEVLPIGPTGERARATISYVAQAVNAQTGAATVRFAFDRPPSSVLVGMSVDINVRVNSVVDALTVPREALGGTGRETFLLRIVGDHVERRVVEVDDWPASSVVVFSGLAAGDIVALDPMSSSSGARVRAQVAADGH
jgi:RND family efflux transporter MFP subunit